MAQATGAARERDPDAIHIATFLPLPPDGLDCIRAVDPRIQINTISQNLVRWMRQPDHPQIDHAAAEAEAEIVRNRDQIWFTFFADRLAAGAPALEWIALASAGADQVLRLQPPPDPHVIATKMPGLAARVIAEWVLTWLLMDVKQMLRHVDSQREARWARHDPGTLDGATVAVIGYGAIGAEVGRLAGAFGTRVVGIRRRATADGTPPEGAPDAVEAIWPPDRLHDVLGEADYVVLAVPLTESTRRLIGAEEIAAMKPGAALINIARGEVVDWEAMVAAPGRGSPARQLYRRHHARTAADGHPSWSVPNLFITPHNSGLQPNYFGKAAARFAENLRRHLNGEPLLDVVDREAGY